MTYDQFWFGDPWIAKTYREAYVERRKAENARDWILGAYMYNAVGIALSNAFRKKGSKPESYLEEPFQIFPLTEAEQAAKVQKEKEKIEAVYRSMLKQQRQKKEQEAAKEYQDAET